MAPYDPIQVQRGMLVSDPVKAVQCTQQQPQHMHTVGRLLETVEKQHHCRFSVTPDCC